MPGNGKKVTDEEPIAVAVENLRFSQDGTYQIDLESLMNGSPLVIKVSDGIYRVDLSPSPRAFKG